MRNIKRFFINAILLTAAQLFMRAVSVAFNVYVSNRIGAEAMGLFSLITGVYGFALTLATSGIHLAVTRLVTGYSSHGNNKCVLKVIKNAVIYCTFFGCLAGTLLWTLSSPIGIHLLEDERTILSLKIFALALPPISISSALNGYFTAVRRVYKNAAVGIIEQWSKIFIISYLLNLLMPEGIEYACISLVLGGTVSELLSCLLMWILWFADKRKNFGTLKLIRNSRSNEKCLSANAAGRERSIMRKLISISLPVAFSSYARSALLTVEHALIPRSLRKSGATHSTSLSIYGTIHSMVLPVILFPSAFISSFSGLLIPELSECLENNNRTQIRYIAGRVFQFTLMFSIGVAGIMMCFSGDISELMYPGKETGKYISLFAPLIPIMYLDSTTDAMLKGLGYQVYSMNVNIFDSALSVLLVCILIPVMGINGYTITIFVCEIINAALSITKLLDGTGLKVRLFRWIFIPIFSIAGAAGIVRLVFEYVFIGGLHKITEIILRILMCICVYFIFLRIFLVISDEDIKWFKRIFAREKVPDTAGDLRV